jgi:hypothetical protein
VTIGLAHRAEACIHRVRQADDQAGSNRSYCGIDLVWARIAGQRAGSIVTGTSEYDDRAGLTRHAVAVRQHHVGGVLRVDDNMPGLGDHSAQGGPAQQIRGVNGDTQPYC